MIVSSRLSVENQKWLTLLSSHLSKVPVTKKDVTENGAIVELIGPFPYFINFQPLDGEQLVPLIEKVRRNVEKTLINAKLVLLHPMIEFLKENCRTEYGGPEEIWMRRKKLSIL